MGVELLTERHKDKIAGILSCYDRIINPGYGARVVLCQRDDRILLPAADQDFRLPEVGRTVARWLARKHGANRCRKWDEDRVRPEQEELSEGRPGEDGSERNAESIPAWCVSCPPWSPAGA